MVAKFLLLLEVVALFEECRRLNSQVCRYGPAQLGKTFLNQNCILTTCSAGDGLAGKLELEGGKVVWTIVKSD